MRKLPRTPFMEEGALDKYLVSWLREAAGNRAAYSANAERLMNGCVHDFTLGDIIGELFNDLALVRYQDTIR
jgi:hypothetical protein